ncbi:MAG: DNA methyltransferase [Candidatus Altiarchaeota archaeon]
MKILLELSGEHEKLPKAELESVLKGERIKYKILEEIKEKRILLLEVKTKNLRFVRRLSLTRKAAEFIAKGKDFSEIAKKIYKRIKKKKNFAIRCASHTIEENLGREIHHLGLKVNLKNPEATILCFNINDVLYVGISIDLERNFNERKLSLRPYHNPTALNPKMARMLVNLAQVKKNDRILDPFCGTGSILIEAALMKMKVFGIEYKRQIFYGCKENLKFYNLCAKVIRGDALKIKFKQKFDAIVSDMPYGRSTILTEKNVSELYRKFIPIASENLKRNKLLVIMIPAEYKINLGRYFSLIAEYLLYVHKSLSRRILVLRRN